jgi:hypothetical protein
MKSLTELSVSGLEWTQKNGRSVLRETDGDTLGEMRHPRWYSARTEVDAHGCRWSFERKGLWKPYIEIRSLGTGEEPARFKHKGHGGDLVYEDGRVYHWQPANWSGRKWLWIDWEDQPVLGIELTGSFTLRGDIQLDPDLTSQKAPSLLLFLGWYLIIAAQDDDVSAAVSVAAIS